MENFSLYDLTLAESLNKGFLYISLSETNETKKSNVGGRDVEAEAVKAVKFLWKRKHFKERSWKRKELGSIWLFEDPEEKHFS